MLSLEIQQEGFTIGGGLVLGGCAGAHLARKEPLILGRVPNLNKPKRALF